MQTTKKITGGNNTKKKKEKKKEEKQRGREKKEKKRQREKKEKKRKRSNEKKNIYIEREREQNVKRTKQTYRPEFSLVFRGQKLVEEGGRYLTILDSKNGHDDRSRSCVNASETHLTNHKRRTIPRKINREGIRESRPRENYVAAWYISHSPRINVSSILRRCIKSLRALNPAKHRPSRCLKIARCVDALEADRGWHELRMKCTVRIGGLFIRGRIFFLFPLFLFFLFFSWISLAPESDTAGAVEKLNEQSRRCLVDVARRRANKTSTGTIDFPRYDYY